MLEYSSCSYWGTGNLDFNFSLSSVPAEDSEGINVVVKTKGYRLANVHSHILRYILSYYHIKTQCTLHKVLQGLGLWQSKRKICWYEQTKSNVTFPSSRIRNASLWQALCHFLKQFARTHAFLLLGKESEVNKTQHTKHFQWSIAGVEASRTEVHCITEAWLSGRPKKVPEPEVWSWLGPVLGEEVIPLLKYQFGFFFSSCESHNFQPCMPSASKETSNLPDEKQNTIRTV